MKINFKNIFANIQKEVKPSRINLNLRNSKMWCPFYFGRYTYPECPLPSIQESDLTYTAPNLQYAYELEDELFDELKASIRSWRRRPTSIRVDIGNRLSGILDILEQSRLEGKRVLPCDYSVKLDTIIRGKSLFGFPLHFSSLDVSTIVQKVRETSVEKSKHPDVEFALATRVIPYYNNIFSVWVFVCSLSPQILTQ